MDLVSAVVSPGVRTELSPLVGSRGRSCSAEASRVSPDWVATAGAVSAAVCLGTTIWCRVASANGSLSWKKTKGIAVAIAIAVATNAIIVIFAAMDHFLAGSDLIPNAHRYSYDRRCR